MKTSSTWKFKSLMCKIMIGLVLGVMIVSIGAVPALAKDGDKRMEKNDNRGDKYKHMEKHDNRGNKYKEYGYDHDRYYYGHQYRPYRNEHRRYRERYYAPPPVIYAPPPRPGISIFFPPIIIHP